MFTLKEETNMKVNHVLFNLNLNYLLNNMGKLKIKKKLNKKSHQKLKIELPNYPKRLVVFV